MKNIDVFNYSREILQTLPAGAFLNAAADGKQNTMTIGWGALGYMWGQQVFTVMVRRSRYTHELLEKNPAFTVSFPVRGDFKQALALCGTKSGRDINKFAAANLTAIPGQTVTVPVIRGCGLHLECKIVETREMQPKFFDKTLAEKWYASQDWHTCYTGIITAAYLEE